MLFQTRRIFGSLTLLVMIFASVWCCCPGDAKPVENQPHVASKCCEEKAKATEPVHSQRCPECPFIQAKNSGMSTADKPVKIPQLEFFGFSSDFASWIAPGFSLSTSQSYAEPAPEPITLVDLKTCQLR